MSKTICASTSMTKTREKIFYRLFNTLRTGSPLKTRVYLNLIRIRSMKMDETQGI